MNIGSGEGISVKNLIFIVKQVVGFEGDLKFDLSKPDGMLKKVLDVSDIKSF
jgi:GDP-L-fucose synthase